VKNRKAYKHQMPFTAASDLTFNKLDDTFVPVESAKKRNLVHVSLSCVSVLERQSSQATHLHCFLVCPVKTYSFEGIYFVRWSNDAIHSGRTTLADHVEFAVCFPIHLCENAGQMRRLYLEKKRSNSAHGKIFGSVDLHSRRWRDL
jgi:hypothetical protein